MKAGPICQQCNVRDREGYHMLCRECRNENRRNFYRSKVAQERGCRPEDIGYRQKISGDTCPICNERPRAIRKQKKNSHMRSYCRECEKRLQHESYAKKVLEETGRVVPPYDPMRCKYNPYCPICLKRGVQIEKGRTESGNEKPYCDECMLAKSKQYNRNYIAKHGAKVVNAVRAPSKEKPVKPKPVQRKKADLVLPAASAKEIKQEARNQTREHIDYREPWIKQPIPIVPIEMIRAATIKRIAQFGPKTSDTPEDIAASGWKPKSMEETIKARYA